jgi:hypothetical protein
MDISFYSVARSEHPLLDSSRANDRHRKAELSIAFGDDLPLVEAMCLKLAACLARAMPFQPSANHSSALNQGFAADCLLERRSLPCGKGISSCQNDCLSYCCPACCAISGCGVIKLAISATLPSPCFPTSRWMTA